MTRLVPVLLVLAALVGLCSLTGGAGTAGDPPPRLPRDNLLVYRGRDGRPAPVKTVADWAKRRALYGHEGRLRLEHPDGGHDFPPEMREAAYRLFDAVLAGSNR